MVVLTTYIVASKRCDTQLFKQFYAVAAHDGTIQVPENKPVH